MTSEQQQESQELELQIQAMRDKLKTKHASEKQALQDKQAKEVRIVKGEEDGNENNQD